MQAKGVRGARRATTLKQANDSAHSHDATNVTPVTASFMPHRKGEERRNGEAAICALAPSGIFQLWTSVSEGGSKP